MGDLETKSIITTLTGHTEIIKAVKVFHKQGNPYLASGSYDKTIMIWNLTNHHLESTLLGHTSYICSLELIPTDNKLYLASGSYDTIKLWDLENYTIKKTFEIQSPVCSLIALNMKNVPYLFSGHYDGKIVVWSENV